MRNLFYKRILHIFEYVFDTLAEKGKVNIKGYGTFILIPIKKGKIWSPKDKEYVKPTYSKRIRFIPSVNLKDKICK